MIRIFRVFIPASVIILLISEVLVTTGAFVLAAFLNPDPMTYLRYGNAGLNISLVVITIIVGIYLHDLYRDIYVKSHIMLLQQLSFVLGAAFLVHAGFNDIDRDRRVPLPAMRR